MELMQHAIVLNIAKVQWTTKRLIFTVTVVYVPHVILFNDISSLSLSAWVLFVFLAYWLSFKQTWQKSLLMVLAHYFVAIVIDHIGMSIISQLPDNLKLYIWENLFILRFVFGAIYLLAFFYTKKLTNRESPIFDSIVYKYWAFYIVFFLSFLVYDVLHVTEFQYFDNLTQVFVVALFVAFFLHTMRYVKTGLLLESTQRELESQRLFAESQKNMLNVLRGNQHNFNATLSTIHGLLDSGEIAQSQSYMEEATEQIRLPETTELSDSVKKIPILRGILIEKIARAEMMGIRFSISVPDEKIDLRYCSDLDYSRMISILLDNALEAADASSQKTMEFIVIWVESGRLVNIITNSCDKEVDIGRIFEEGYSAKPNPSGMGLPQLRSIQDKYRKEGYFIDINTVFENGLFTQVLKI